MVKIRGPEKNFFRVLLRVPVRARGFSRTYVRKRNNFAIYKVAHKLGINNFGLIFVKQKVQQDNVLNAIVKRAINVKEVFCGFEPSMGIISGPFYNFIWDVARS